MNERIKQLLALADQMTLTAIVQTDIKFDSEDFNAIKFEKFAELIVREAAAFVSGAAEVYNKAEQEACVSASKGLNKYF